MKTFKKISFVYLLQVFAVVLIFGYTDSSAGKETKKTLTDVNAPEKISKTGLIKTHKDSIQTIHVIPAKNYQIKTSN